jgi:hypothetical protein
MRLRVGLRGPELADVGAARKTLAGTDQHDSPDRRIRLGARDRLDDRAPHLEAKAVDRRIIQAQDGNCAADLEVHVTHTPTRRSR